MRASVREDKIRAAGFALDLMIQLTRLRRKRSLTYEELSQKLQATTASMVKSLENPRREDSVQWIEQLAEAMDAYVHIVVVPKESYERYQRNLFLPLVSDEEDEEVVDA